jgi:hypothetical protein
LLLDVGRQPPDVCISRRHRIELDRAREIGGQGAGAVVADPGEREMDSRRISGESHGHLVERFDEPLDRETDSNLVRNQDQHPRGFLTRHGHAEVFRKGTRSTAESSCRYVLRTRSQQ